VLETDLCRLPGKRFADRREQALATQQIGPRCRRGRRDRVPNLTGEGDPAKNKPTAVLDREGSRSIDLSREKPRAGPLTIPSGLFDMADFHVGGNDNIKKTDEESIAS